MGKKLSPRPFRISDGLVLIAAVAASFALIKWSNHVSENLFRIEDGAKFFAGAWADRRDAWKALGIVAAILFTLLVAPLSMAVLVLRTREPRPPWCRIWRQPGATACLACLFPFVWWGLTLVGQAIVGRAMGIPWGKIDYHLAIPAGSGVEVFLIWFVLWISGTLRCERSWLDRLGRGLGMTMIVVYLAMAVGVHWLDATTPAWSPPILPNAPPSGSGLFPPEDSGLPPVFPAEPSEAAEPPPVLLPPPQMPSGFTPAPDPINRTQGVRTA